MVKAPERWIKKQIDRVTVAEDEYKAGIDAVTEAPTIKAAEKKEKYLRRIQEAADHWEKRLRAIDLGSWKEMATKKAPRFTEGVRLAEHKIRSFVTKWQPILQEIQSAVNALPDLTDADREKRMIENLRRLKAAKGKWL